MDKKMMSISISMMVLRLLEEEERYGYQIIKELEERSEQVFSLKEGTLYPVLHALEGEGSIEGYEKVADSGRKRKYYQITRKGKKVLESKQEEWKIYQKAVNHVIGGNAYGRAIWCD